MGVISFDAHSRLAKVDVVVVMLIVLAAGTFALSGCNGGSTTVPAGATVSASPTDPLATLTPPAEPTAAPPQPTPPSVETSTWQTFSSPLGFDIRYPPGWTVFDSGVGVVPLESVKIFNEIAEAGRLANLSKGIVEADSPEGAAWLEILPLRRRDSGVDGMKFLCGTAAQRSEGTVQTDDVLVDGRPAVSCSQQTKKIDGSNDLAIEILWFQTPSGRTVHVASYEVTAADNVGIPLSDTLRVAQSTISFQ